MYFGDAGSPNVLHLLGAERAACAIIALDTPGANYRAVYAMTKVWGCRSQGKRMQISDNLSYPCSPALPRCQDLRPCT